MERARIHEGIRRMRLEDLLARQERGEVSQVEAAEMLGVSERTLRRWQSRLRDEGPSGLGDRRLGRVSPRRVSEEEIARMLGLYRERYEGFSALPGHRDGRARWRHHRDRGRDRFM